MPINQSQVNRTPLPVVDFDWTPKSIAFVYTTGGNTYPYSRQSDNVSRSSDTRYSVLQTPTNTLITFVANVIVPTNIQVIQYLWGFGNGELGYGPTISYMYKVALPNAEASLTITDSLGRVRTRHRVLNLRPANPITVTPFVIRSS
jgi:hypothetical protein